jgi:hypothetical protein
MKKGLTALALAVALPGLAAELPVPDIAFQKFTLDNGLTLIVHEDHKAPIVAVNVWYHVGSKNEKPVAPASLTSSTSDVQRQRKLQRRLLQGRRTLGATDRSERHDQQRPDELLPERAEDRARHDPLAGIRPMGISPA